MGDDGFHQPLRATLEAIQPGGAAEAADLAAALRLTEEGDPWSRTSALHITGSALIVHPASRRVLLRWHRRQRAWLQVGGHADPGEVDPFHVIRVRHEAPCIRRRVRDPPLRAVAAVR